MSNFNYKLTVNGNTINYGMSEHRAWEAYFDAKNEKSTAKLEVFDNLGNIVRVVYC